MQLGGREKNKIVFVWQKRLDVTFDVSIDNAHKNQISFLKKARPIIILFHCKNDKTRH